MRRALYDPELGYYASHIRDVGKQGDFSTSATISTALGEAIASWLVQKSDAQPDVSAIIEMGGGSGTLMRALRSSLAWWQRRKFRFFMVEASPSLRAKQQEALHGSGIRWFSYPQEALSACGGRAFLFHNELLDAFPVTLIEWNAEAQAWEEIFLHATTQGWSEARAPLSLPTSDQSAYHVLSTRPGFKSQRAELGSDARAWLQTWAPSWVAGAMLTIDYGDDFPQVYRARPRGTLRAYQAHQLFTGPDLYQHMGQRDLTADVNFSDLRRWGEAFGWQSSPLETQHAFLRRHLPRCDQRIAHDQALAFLMNEQGAGSEFKVIEQFP